MPAVAPIERASSTHFLPSHVTIPKFQSGKRRRAVPYQPKRNGSEGDVLRLCPSKRNPSQRNLRRLDRRPPKSPRRTQRRKINPHKQIQALGPEGLRRAPRKTSRGKFRTIPEERLRPRVCEEVPAGGERKKSLRVRPVQANETRPGTPSLNDVEDGTRVPKEVKTPTL